METRSYWSSAIHAEANGSLHSALLAVYCGGDLAKCSNLQNFL